MSLSLSLGCGPPMEFQALSELHRPRRSRGVYQGTRPRVPPRFNRPFQETILNHPDLLPSTDRRQHHPAFFYSQVFQHSSRPGRCWAGPNTGRGRTRLVSALADLPMRDLGSLTYSPGSPRHPADGLQARPTSIN